MTLYNEIKSKHQKAYDKILKDCQVFWAFGQDQLKEGIKKNKITKENKMVEIGSGGYMPSKHFDKFIKETGEEDKRYKEELKTMRKEQDGAILYELNNHECFYTNRLDEVMDIFKGIFTPAKINRVFKKHQESSVLS